MAHTDTPTDVATDSSTQNHRRRGLFRRRRGRHEGSGEGRSRTGPVVGVSHSDTESRPRPMEEEKRRRKTGARSVAPTTRKAFAGGLVGPNGAAGGHGAGNGGGVDLSASVRSLNGIGGAPGGGGGNRDQVFCPMPQPLHRIRSTGAVDEGGGLSQDPDFFPPIPLPDEGTERPSPRGELHPKRGPCWALVAVSMR